MYFAKTPLLIQRIFHNLTWKIANSEKVYLTFDDGPVPEATPWVLDILAKHTIKATFFCVGENVEKHPEIYQRILDEGHAVGNHTYNHLNGWKTDNEKYLTNISKAEKVINTTLYRPPYGKLVPAQIKALSPKYNIIMWDVLSGDFDSNISAEECYSNVSKNAKEGSIIVFHDSIKAIDTLKEVLPKVINFFESKGLAMGKIE